MTNDGSVAAQLTGLWTEVSPMQSALRVGIDVVDVGVLARQLKGELGLRFRSAMFTAQEITDSRGRPERFATRWALKEAVAKAIGTGFRGGLEPRMVEVVTKASGAIHVRPAADAHWPQGAEDWTWAASASHEMGVAAAIALAVTPQQRERDSDER